LAEKKNPEQKEWFSLIGISIGMLVENMT